jgi:RNA 3'-terminal phosphate cyclase (ATP)
MLAIDGSIGEGGGQVLRTALALSILTGTAIRVENIRAHRPKPGLMAQHLKALEAAAAVAEARVDGATLHSTVLTFEPGALRGGDFRFDIGTAGSACLVLQTVLLPLCYARTVSHLTITGGTHVPWSPCYHYLEQQWLPSLRTLGVRAEAQLQLAGFYPRGGGWLHATIHPDTALRPLRVVERGVLRRIRGVSAVANLDLSVAERQRRQALLRLGPHEVPVEIELLRLPARGKGTLLLLIADCAGGRACYSALGAPGKPAERVADEAVTALDAFLATDGAVDQYLADQLVLPMALAPGVSELRTSCVTPHLLTNCEIVRRFLPSDIRIEGDAGRPGLLRIRSDGLERHLP